MWRYLSIVIICSALGYFFYSQMKVIHAPVSLAKVGSPSTLNPSLPSKHLPAAAAEEKNAPPAITSSDLLPQIHDSKSEKSRTGAPSDAEASAATYIKAANDCAQKLGLPFGKAPENNAEWQQPANQEALKECMAREGVKPRSIQEDKKRDLEELNACVRRQTNFPLPPPTQWKKLPIEVKAAIQGCRNVLMGWVMQSQLDRLLELDK